MARMSKAEAVDYYLKLVLGDDYEQQFEQDLLDAVKEVNDGYITGG